MVCGNIAERERYHLLEPRHNCSGAKISEVWDMGAVTRDKSRAVCKLTIVSIHNCCWVLKEHRKTNCSQDSQSQPSLKPLPFSVRPQIVRHVVSLPQTPLQPVSPPQRVEQTRTACFPLLGFPTTRRCLTVVSGAKIANYSRDHCNQGMRDHSPCTSGILYRKSAKKRWDGRGAGEGLPGCSPEHLILRLRQVRHLRKHEVSITSRISC